MTGPGHQPNDAPDAGATPPPAAHRVADELLRRFALGPPLHLEVAPGGLLNQNLFARTARGAYFLKGYRYSVPLPIKREHWLIAFATAAGLPALSPIATPSGETVLRVGGRWWAIFPRLKPHQPGPDQLSVQHAAELGRVLGRIHVALATIPPLEVSRFPAKVTWDSARALAEMAEYEVTIQRRPTLDPFDQHTLSSFGFRRTLLAGGVPPVASFAGLPAQLLHGDFHTGNLFWDGAERIHSVIDWELAGVGPRAWEIVRVLDLSLRLASDVESGAERLTAFVHGYVSVATLTGEECGAMGDLYWAARVHSLWAYEEHYRKGSAKTDRVAMDDLALLHWLAANRGRVAAALRDALATAPPRELAG